MRRLFSTIFAAIIVMAVSAQQSVGFTINARFGCVDTFALVNQSTGYDYYVWDFGTGDEGDTVYSADVLTMVTYKYSGTYTITLTGVDTVTGNVGTCSSLVRNVQGHYYSTAEDFVQCNQPYYYSEAGTTHIGPGTYVDTVSRDGCTYLYRLVLHPQTSYSYQTRQLCTNDTVMLGDQLITEPGVYYDTVTADNGCETIIVLTALKEPTISIVNHWLCNTQSLDINGIHITSNSVVDDTIRTAYGCDSIVRHVVNFQTIFNTIDTVWTCPGESVEFYGKTCTNPGSYIKSFSRANYPYCDSIYTMVLMNYPTFHETTDTLTQVYPFTWHGKSITEEGTYYDSLRSSTGCDSIYQLNIRFDYMYLTLIRDTMCSGDFYIFGGRRLTAGGTYYDSLHAVTGNDSIIKLELFVPTALYFRDTVETCESQYTFLDSVFTVSGEYDIVLTDRYGCDSLAFHLSLFLNKRNVIITRGSIDCNSPDYFWRGNSYSSAGRFVEHHINVNGCDSDYILYLSVASTSEMVDICQGDSFVFKNRALMEPGIYYDTLLNECGMLYAHELILNVHPAYQFYDTVHISEGSFYNFRGQMVSSAGDHFDSLRTHYGCDSIYQLHIIVEPRFHEIEYQSVCSATPYVWRGRYITQSGTYFDSLKTAYGCDSVYELRININPPVVNATTVNICNGSTYTLGGNDITESGTYYDTLKTDSGCDSIVILTINVLPTVATGIGVSLCRGDTFSYEGIDYTTAGTHYEHHRTTFGCDSMTIIAIQVYDPTLIVEYDTVCSNQPYLWHGMSITASGVYYDRQTTTMGCDSVYELHLDFHRNCRTRRSETICRGTTFRFGDIVCTETGRYYDTLQSVYGCDSIVELCLNVESATYHNVSKRICRGDYYQFGDRLLTDPGIYQDTFLCIHGCDSIVRLTLSYTESQSEVRANICEGESFFFRGRDYTHSGIYYDTLPSTQGCDSIIKLIVQILPTYLFSNEVSITSGTAYNFRGRSVSQSGIYWDSLRTNEGCDSIYKLQVRFRDPSVTVINRSICSAQHYTTPTGRQLNTPGVYYDTLISSTGGDSILEIHLNVTHNVEVFDSAMIVKGHTYYYHGRPYSIAGTYYDTARSVFGCDTFFQLYLTYQPYVVALIDTAFCDNYPFRTHGRLYTETITDSFVVRGSNTNVTDTLFVVTTHVSNHSVTNLSDSTCDNTPYQFGNRLLTASGLYTDTLRAANGCDSIVNLSLRVFDRIVHSETYTICEGNSYLWHGRTLTSGGTYRDTTIDASCGCNEYYEIQLNVIAETMVRGVNNQTNTVTVCGDDDTYTITPTYSGTPPTRYSITYDGVNIPNRNDVSNAPYDGSDIVVQMPRDDNGNVRPGIYTVTLNLGNDYCNESSWSLDYKLIVEYPSSILDQHFNDVVSVFSAAYNGGYTFSGFRWYVNGAMVEGATGSNLYLTMLEPGDEVYAELCRATESTFIPTCSITIQDLGPEPQEYPVMINGTYYMPGEHAAVRSHYSGTYRLYDMRGAMVASGSLDPDADTPVTMPYISGCYLLMVNTEIGSQTFKLIVR